MTIDDIMIHIQVHGKCTCMYPANVNSFRIVQGGVQNDLC